jgi:DNA recombination protein RmuC
VYHQLPLDTESAGAHGLAGICVTPLVQGDGMADTASTPVLVLLIVCVVIGAGVGVAVSVLVTRRSSVDRDEVIRAALAHAAVLGREQLGAHTAASTADLGAKKDAITDSLDQVRREVRGELHRLSSLVNQLGQMSAERFGQVDRSLTEHTRVATSLAESTRTLREALANPQARGQWGERMADDVLRLAGFIENVNYVRQTRIAGRADGATAIPDYTFSLPHGHALHMDVKFPLASYVKHLEATTDIERDAHLRDFLRDVRQRVRELAARGYASGGARPSLDYVVLFLPNEHLAGFIHENDPGIIDMALAHKVVLCSPLTLYAFLGVIRQAYDNFVVEQTSDQILALIGAFDLQWGKFTDALDGVKRRLDSTQRDLDSVLGTRRRALERPLQELEALRRHRDVDRAADPAVVGAPDPAVPHLGTDGDRRDRCIDGPDLAASAV